MCCLNRTRTLFWLLSCALMAAGAAHGQDANGALSVRKSRATNVARFVTAADGKAIPVPLARGRLEAQPIDFFRAYGELFGITDPDSELVPERTVTDALAYTHTTFQQVYQSVPVFAGLLRVHTDGRGQITAVNGTFIPDIKLSTTPVLTAGEAAAIALAEVAGQTSNQTILTVASNTLYVFRANLARGVPGPNHLVYEVEVGNGADVREFVYVDAHKGHVVDQITGIYHSLYRKIYDGEYGPGFVVWEEGDPPYTPGDPDVAQAIDYSEDTYNLVASITNGAFLSYDGGDAIMENLVNTSYMTCPNASWNGIYTQYCTGVAGDDVVGHEWGHAYTDGTHNLIYMWQPGALNEAYSDIYGEVVDLLNGAGTDSPGPLRADGECSTFTTYPPEFEVNSPPGIAGLYPTGDAAFNPPPPVTVPADVEYAYDGDDEGGTASVYDGCQTLIGFTAGRIALIDRGTCAFVTKTANALAAGAVGVVVANNQSDDPVNMGGDGSYAIPSVSIGQSDGNAIKGELPGVNATIRLSSGTDPSLRWLHAEDATSYSQPNRDMWNPPCRSDPGKVTDTEYYYCGTEDQGGVHTNSGVPNHAFALLVDGGTYNGYTITGIGLTKAFHIYWRAQSVYQVPSSDFADHAYALWYSCDNLIGVDLYALSTEVPTGSLSGVSISSDDCSELVKAIYAVELLTEPTFCGFTPLLDPNAPPLCEPASAPLTIVGQDWEAGLGAWTVGTRNVANSATFDTPDWAVVGSLPDGRVGSAAFVADLVIGNCDDDTEAGVLYLESPSIPLPAGTYVPRVAFNHWVATETNWDGGNVKINVNGGGWTLVPYGAFDFNPYSGALSTGDNPLGGEDAFHGANEGGFTGSWGQSQISLSGIANPGDTIQLRFEMGLDGCNGLVGWYVDDVQIFNCADDCNGNYFPDVLEDQPLPGYALQFDGQQQYVNLGSPDALDQLAQGDFTLEMWIRTSEVVRGVLIGNYSGNPSWNFEIHSNAPAGHLRLYLDGEAHHDNAVVADGQWHHVAAVRTNGVAVKMYIDGAEAYNESSTTGAYTVPRVTMIGRDPRASSHYFGGMIDDVRVWDFARAAVDIAADRYSVLNGTEEGLVAYWRFDEGTGTTAYDSVAAKDGTLIGTPPPAWLTTDCNADEVPDECEIPVTSGGLCIADCDPDCNGNSIPDECEMDCNTNDVPDECDVDPTDPDGNGYVSEDLNANDVPDECEEDFVYVDDDAQTRGDGTTWAMAYKYLQDALAGAPADSYIFVADGTYRPDQGGSVTPLDRDATFQLINGISINGGYRGCLGADCVSQDPYERDVETYETILNGDLASNDVPVPCTQDSPDCDSYGELCTSGSCIIKQNNEENSYHVVTGSGTDTTAVLAGFTITGGNADGFKLSHGTFGGGMYNDAGSPTVTNCTFRANSGYHCAGGIHNTENSDPTVANCTFSGNSATSGGGMCNEFDSSPTVTNCAFSGNKAWAGIGGGMFNAYNSSPTLTDCIFIGNLSGNGGGMTNWDSSPTLTNCIFSGNGDYFGGGMFNDNSSPTLTNCTFTGNHASMGAGGMANLNSSNPTLTNCILYGDTGGEIENEDSSPTVTYSDVQGGYSGTDNIDADPRFIDSDGPDNVPGTHDDNLRLSIGSPCIDAGRSDRVAVGTDLDGNPRIMDGDGDETATVDMGAYEYYPDCNGNGILDTCDLDCNALGGDCNVPDCGLSSDDNENGVPDECDCPELDPPSTPAGEAGYEKIRYISMVPGNSGYQTALRVTLTTLPEPYDGFNGTQMWVGEPATYCENAGKVTPPCPEEQPTTEFVGADLECTPHCMDWSTVEVLHVSDDEIIPGAVYDVQAIDCECDFENEAYYSAPLTITTSIWGDAVRNCAVYPCGPPDGTVGIPTDVTALLDKFKNLGPPTFNPAIIKSRADVDWNIPNRRVDISDVTFCLDAFRGVTYPPLPPDLWPGPGGCP